ncbi:hypothetical protein [Halofilum ochraceum]|uniref:hypothetical protein n=1 Tax=Halofilum ochraceum TaxID=1611323 RepID=UPI0008DA1076|nr:hypothetical protein [Halofilum ochraceum]
MLDWRAVEAEEDRLRAAAAGLPDQERAAFHREARRRLKDPDTYAVLNWFFIVGLHHFYLGRHGRGLLDVGLVAAGIGLMVEGHVLAGLGPILAVLILELGALFRSQVIVQDWNNRIQRQLLRAYGADPDASAADPGHNR